MEWIEANGASLRYELSGSGRDILVLVHEVGGCIESWDDTLPAFQPHFRVLRYDQRGFGMSEKTRVITMDTIVDDLAALLDVLGITGRAHLAGCAMGAAISLAFAGRHPARVARVVAASPATWANANPEAARKRIEETERGGVRAVPHPSPPAPPPPPPPPPRKKKNKKFRLRWLGNDPEAMAALLRMS